MTSRPNNMPQNPLLDEPQDLRLSGGQHILVAEDNHANQLIARTILERDGYKVTIAPNGEDALIAVETLAARDEFFDFILMDILMPVMDGIKALRRIKDLSPKIKTPPIFAITAFCSPADQHRYRMAGFDAILTKPLKHGDVEQALKQSTFARAIMPANAIKGKRQNFEQVDMLDGEIINQLRRAADHTRLKLIQTTFWNDVKMNSQIIQAALPEALNATPCGVTVLRKSIHTIKGASASVGLLRAAHIARHLQNAPPSHMRGLLKALFETLLMSKAPLSTALFQSAPYQSPPYKAHPNQRSIPNYAAAPQIGVNARIG